MARAYTVAQHARSLNTGSAMPPPAEKPLPMAEWRARKRLPWWRKYLPFSTSPQQEPIMADTTTAPTLTIADRIALARGYHAAGTITQNTWRTQDEQGRELVCALAAFGPDINGSGDCPADLMPPWMASLVPAIDDGIAKDQVLWFSGELIDRAARWHALDDAAWDRIQTGLLIAGVRQAISAASAVHQDNPPEYWPGVVAACDQVCTALQTGTGLEEAKAAASS